MVAASNELENTLERDAEVFRTGRLIALVMLSGVAFFAMVLVFIHGGALQERVGLVGMVGLAMAGGSLVMSVFLPGLLGNQLLSKSSSGESAPAGGVRESLRQAWLTRTLISVAILEGAAVVNFIAGLMETSWFSLAAMAVIWGVMLARVPRAAAMRSWIDERQDELARNNGG
jgi:hypothetical protein